MLFDSHVHLLDGRFDADREDVIASLAAHGVAGAIECATEPQDMEAAARLAQSHPQIYAAVGVHPHTADKYDGAVGERIEQLLKMPKVVAIGEIGLDYHYDFCPRELQKSVLRAQLAIARRTGAPVILHSREATEDMLDILAQFSPLCGVMHCFSGSAEVAGLLLGMGLHIGVGGAMTFIKPAKAEKILAVIPMERLLLETDCPYLAPVPLRGERNVPWNTALVAGRIAAARGTTPEEIADITMKNALSLFKI